MSGAIQFVGDGRSLSDPVDCFLDGDDEDATGKLTSLVATDGRRPGLEAIGAEWFQLGEFITGLWPCAYLLIPLTERLRRFLCVPPIGPFAAVGLVG